MQPASCDPSIYPAFPARPGNLSREFRNQVRAPEECPLWVESGHYGQPVSPYTTSILSIFPAPSLSQTTRTRLPQRGPPYSKEAAPLFCVDERVVGSTPKPCCSR